MNATTFNDSFLKFRNAEGVAADKAKCKRMMESPLIKWEEPTDADFNELDFPDAFFPNSCPRLPFDHFRVDGFYHYKGDGFMKFKAWVNQDGVTSNSPGFSLVFQIERSNEGKIESLGLRPVLVIVTAVFSKPRTATNPPTIKWVWTHFDTEKGTTYRQEMSGDLLWSICGEWLQKLCIDFYNPHLYLCKKSPTIPHGKSVVWQKAREHYVLLHKTHAANNRDAHGKKIIQDGPTVDRISHSRRAHFRLLRSPRFRHKQGQRIWVQSAWIGPKEWTDKSGQIYRIVERPNIRS